MGLLGLLVLPGVVGSSRTLTCPVTESTVNLIRTSCMHKSKARSSDRGVSLVQAGVCRAFHSPFSPALMREVLV